MKFTSWTKCREYFDREVLDKEEKYTVDEEKGDTRDSVFLWWVDDNADILEITEAKEIEDSDAYDLLTAHKS